MKEVDKFKYLGVNGVMEEEVNSRLLERRKVWGSCVRFVVERK